MKYLNGLPDYYNTLRVSQNAKSSEIKKAFRLRAKEIHPDIGDESPQTLAAMRELLSAYEILIHDDLRYDYDIQYRVAVPRNEFNYREFLQSRYNDPKSTGKLIFFDLLHEHEKEALDLYNTLHREKNFSLSDHLDREDFMDCAFLLAESYEKQGDFFASFNLLKTLVAYELENPYFRHFFQEVLDKLKTLLLHKLVMPIPQHIEYLLEIVQMPLKKRDQSLFMKKVSDLYLEYNDVEKAEFFFAEAKKLYPRITVQRKKKDQSTQLSVLQR